jgi:hypothetical protein
VPRSNDVQTDAVPVLVKTVSFEEGWEQASGWRTRVDPRLLLVVALLAGVFACFFAIGRGSGGSSTSGAEAPARPAVLASRATVPLRLSSAPPLDTGSAANPAPAPAPAAVVKVPPVAPATAVRPLQEVPASQPAPTPARAPAPTPAPSQPAPSSAPVLPTGGSGPTSKGGASPPSSGGGSFDTSG